MVAESEVALERYSHAPRPKRVELDRLLKKTQYGARWVRSCSGKARREGPARRRTRVLASRRITGPRAGASIARATTSISSGRDTGPRRLRPCRHIHAGEATCGSYASRADRNAYSFDRALPSGAWRCGTVIGLYADPFGLVSRTSLPSPPSVCVAPGPPFRRELACINRRPPAARAQVEDVPWDRGSAAGLRCSCDICTSRRARAGAAVFLALDRGSLLPRALSCGSVRHSADSQDHTENNRRRVLHIASSPEPCHRQRTAQAALTASALARYQTRSPTSRSHAGTAFVVAPVDGRRVERDVGAFDRHCRGARGPLAVMVIVAPGGGEGGRVVQSVRCRRRGRPRKRSELPRAFERSLVGESPAPRGHPDGPPR